jgi:hypothetical protein
MPAMTTYRAHFTGSLVAECYGCGAVCVYWDNDDLNDDGELECHCQGDGIENIGGVS